MTSHAHCAEKIVSAHWFCVSRKGGVTRRVTCTYWLLWLSVEMPWLVLGGPIGSSLGTGPSKNRKGGSGTLAGVEVYTAPGMKAHFRLAFD